MRLARPYVAAVVAATLALAAAGAFAGPGSRTPAEVEWRSWDAGVREAATAGRPVLVDVYTQWCGWCRRMDRDVYAREDVREYLDRHFVSIKLDAESRQGLTYQSQKLTERSLATRFRISSFPTTVFLRSDGTHLVNVPGYVPADRFLLLLRYVADGHMDRGTPFDAFVRAQAGRPSGK